MVLASSELPSGFADMEAFVDGWARPTERERRHICASKTMSEIQSYYDRVGPRISAIAAHLDAFPMTALPEREAKLCMLAQMYMETAVVVEFLHAPDMGPEQISQDRWHILDV